MTGSIALLRALAPAVRQEVSQRKFAFGLAAALASGLALGYALDRLLESPASGAPYGAIAGSLVVDLAGLGVLLTRLPAAASGAPAWAGVRAWASSTLLCGAALAGLWCTGRQGEPPRTFLVLWLLFAAQAALAAAVHGWLALAFRFEPRVALQGTLLVLGVAVTAVFWSREPIQFLGRGGAGGGDWLADAVLRYSPPLAVASAWHQESAAARGGRARFDIVRGHLTYRVWIGSYQAVAYPRMLGVSEGGEGGGLRVGVVPGMLACGLLLLLVADGAVGRRRGQGGPAR